MLYFDSHIHVGNFDVQLNAENRGLLAYDRYSKNTPENCIRKALAAFVSKGVVFPFPIMEKDFSKQNNYVLEAACKFPYFFIPFLLPEPPEQLEKRKELFVGIKDHFYFDFHKQVCRDEILDFAQGASKVYIFHAHWKDWGNRVRHICKNFPRLKVIIAHSGRPVPFLGGNLELSIKEFKTTISSRLRENFYFETSTVRDCVGIEKLVSAFGADHVLWGTDFPYFSERGENVFAVERAVINNAAVSDSDKNMIFNGTFRALFQGDSIWIRPAVPSDSDSLLSILSGIDLAEKKFLALPLKTTLVKRLMKTGNHILVAESHKGAILGFLRRSDRHNNGVLVEEVYVVPVARRNNLATRLIQAVCPSYDSVSVKTLAANVGMNKTLTRLKFKPTYSLKGTIISWTKEK